MHMPVSDQEVLRSVQMLEVCQQLGHHLLQHVCVCQPPKKCFCGAPSVMGKAGAC